jgi:hypothetical protein
MLLLVRWWDGGGVGVCESGCVGGHAHACSHRLRPSSAGGTRSALLGRRHRRRPTQEHRHPRAQTGRQRAGLCVWAVGGGGWWPPSNATQPHATGAAPPSIQMWRAPPIAIAEATASAHPFPLPHAHGAHTGTHLDGLVEVGLGEHQHILVRLDRGAGQAALEAGREGEQPEEHAVHGVCCFVVRGRESGARGKRRQPGRGVMVGQRECQSLRSCVMMERGAAGVWRPKGGGHAPRRYRSDRSIRCVAGRGVVVAWGLLLPRPRTGLPAAKQQPPPAAAAHRSSDLGEHHPDDPRRRRSGSDREEQETKRRRQKKNQPRRVVCGLEKNQWETSTTTKTSFLKASVPWVPEVGF